MELTNRQGLTDSGQPAEVCVIILQLFTLHQQSHLEHNMSAVILHSFSPAPLKLTAATQYISPPVPIKLTGRESMHI